jgi:MFS family permease
MGIATALAPLIGGAITQWIGWRWVFLLNLPACALLAAGVRAAIAESRDPHATRVDAPGSLLFGAALACAIAALIGAPSHGWLTGATLGRLGSPPRCRPRSSPSSAATRGRWSTSRCSGSRASSARSSRCSAMRRARK